MADVSLLEELDSLVVITGDKKRVGLYARAADRIRELEERVDFLERCGWEQ